MSEISLLEKKLAEEPIKIPSSPFWDVFKRFGRDEVIAMFVNAIGTGLADYFLGLGNAAKETKDFVLSITGPIVEKIGFFPAHFKEAFDVYKTTPAKERKSLSSYFGRAVKGGAKSLAEDILIHDPLYIGLMFGGRQLYPETPAWLLSVGSFITAVFAVAGLEVGFNELAYANRKRTFKSNGFNLESYLESRFLISSEVNPEEVLEALAKKFELNEPKQWTYKDVYFDTRLKIYSARTPKLRLRQRENSQGEKRQSAQVIYTRATEIAKNEVDQYRYFPIRKDKLYFVLDQEMPNTIYQIEDKEVRKILSKAAASDQPRHVTFERTVAYEDALLISADRVKTKRPFNVVELKTYKSIDVLKEAIRYILRSFPVVQQTTHGKSDLAVLNGD